MPRPQAVRAMIAVLDAGKDRGGIYLVATVEALERAVGVRGVMFQFD